MTRLLPLLRNQAKAGVVVQADVLWRPRFLHQNAHRSWGHYQDYDQDYLLNRRILRRRLARCRRASAT